MRNSDWSSDVCSSDLQQPRPRPPGVAQDAHMAFGIVDVTLPRRRVRQFGRRHVATVETQDLELVYINAATVDIGFFRHRLRGVQRFRRLIPATAVQRIVHELRIFAGRSEETTSELQSLMRIS